MTNRHIVGSPEARMIVINATASWRRRHTTNNLLLAIFLFQGKDPQGVSPNRSSILLEKKGLLWSCPCAALNQSGSILSVPPSQGSWRHAKKLFFSFLSPGWTKAFSLHIFQMCCVTAHYSSLSHLLTSFHGAVLLWGAQTGHRTPHMVGISGAKVRGMIPSIWKRWHRSKFRQLRQLGY